MSWSSSRLYFGGVDAAVAQVAGAAGPLAAQLSVDGVQLLLGVVMAAGAGVPVVMVVVVLVLMLVVMVVVMAAGAGLVLPVVVVVSDLLHQLAGQVVAPLHGRDDLGAGELVPGGGEDGGVGVGSLVFDSIIHFLCTFNRQEVHAVRNVQGSGAGDEKDAVAFVNSRFRQAIPHFPG